MPTKKISAEEYNRYQRHFSLNEIGIDGQQKLKSSAVLLVGAGGLGSPVALYLVAAGIGRLGIVDFDVVDESNLQRQILHGSSDIGQPKTASALRRLNELNPHVEIEIFQDKFCTGNARALISKYDVIVDGTDNFAARYLINDASYFEGRPLVSGAIFGFEGQVSVFNYQDGPCYRCLFPAAPTAGTVPNCSENGVLGVLPGIIGTMQALEVLKIIVGFGEVLSFCVAYFNALVSELSKIRITKSPHCPLCGKAPTITELVEDREECAATLGATAVHEIAWHDISQRDRQSIYLLDVRSADERLLSAIPESVHIGLGELEPRLSEIPSDKDIVVYCKSGSRSRMAAEILLRNGYSRVRSLQGGIVRWQFELGHKS